MVTHKVRRWPDPVLAQMCEPVDLADLALPTLVEDLFETMYAANGRGLAAPQIGVLQRVFVVDMSWKEGTYDPLVFINPVIENTSKEIITMDEQCLSIPDLPMPVRRPDHIQLSWKSRNGIETSDIFNGILARCIQHEFDHLNGTVIFDHQSPEDRTALEIAYAS